MRIVCLDLEGVLVPEIWIEFAERSGIPELRRTTRDEPDYDTLMKYRLDILAQKKLGLPDIQAVIASMGPMQGAREFLDALRDIAPGEELFFDYGLVIDARMTPKLKKEYACWCGTPSCRGTMLAIKRRKKAA